MEIASKSQAENGADNTTIMTPLRVKQAIKANGGGGGGTSDYNQLQNRPQINSVTLTGNKTSSGLGLQDTLISGTNIKTINNQSLLGSGNITVGGGTSTDVQVNGTSITSGGVANILTQGAYSSSNKIATMADLPTIPTVPTKTSDLINDGDGTHPFLLNGSPSYIDTISTYGGGSAYARNLSYTWDNGVVSENHIIANYEDIPTRVSDLQNDSGFLTTETDPVFSASAAAGITSSDITNWNAAEANVQSDWNQSDNTADDYIKNKPTIPVVPTNVSSFVNDAGYLTAYTETDPVFSSSAAASITSADITSWNGKQNTIIAGDGIDKLNDTLSLEIPTYYWDGTDTADNRAMFNEICGIYDNGGKFILYGRLLMDAGWSYNGTYTSDPRSVVVPITVTDFTSREAAGSTYYSFSSSPVYIGYRYIIGTVKATGSWGAFTKVEWATYNEDMSPARLSEVNAKQDTLVSGTNIKTINNTSILGSGNIDIQGSVPANVAYKNIDNNFSTGQTINGSTHIHPPTNEWTCLNVYSSNRNEASIAYHNEALTKRYVAGYGTASFDGFGIYCDETAQNLLRVDKDGNSIATKSFRIPANSSNGYGLADHNGTSIIKDWDNGTITMNATGGTLFLGHQTTGSINFLDGKGTWDASGLKIGNSKHYCSNFDLVIEGGGYVRLCRVSTASFGSNGNLFLKVFTGDGWNGQPSQNVFVTAQIKKSYEAMGSELWYGCVYSITGYLNGYDDRTRIICRAINVNTLDIYLYSPFMYSSGRFELEGQFDSVSNVNDWWSALAPTDGTEQLSTGGLVQMSKIIYDNSSGTNGDVYLSETSANFRYIDIQFRSNDGENFVNSQRIYDPNGKYTTLLCSYTGDNNGTLYQKARVVYINGTSISTQATNRYSEATIRTSSASASKVNQVYITKVIGYR